MKKLLNILGEYAEDLLILAGLALICVATFRISTTAGIYAVGVSCLGLGLVIARYPPRKR